MGFSRVIGEELHRWKQHLIETALVRCLMLDDTPPDQSRLLDIVFRILSLRWLALALRGLALAC